MAIRPWGRRSEREARRMKLSRDAAREGKRRRKQQRPAFTVDEETLGRAYAAVQGSGASR
jgi:hypothetical protein